jgi:hypothetical protein
VDLQEYIAASLTRGDGEDFGDFLEAAENMARVEVKKVAAHYVTFVADAGDAETMGRQFSGKYKISPNRGLQLFG